MIEIRPIRNDEVAEAKRLIFSVAHTVFREEGTLEEAMVRLSAEGKLAEMSDIQRNYFENGGTFLVSIFDGCIIGTGAIRRLEAGVCELKRLWLAINFHGRGYGFLMMQELLKAARGLGYQKMRLLTDPVVQTQAVRFYEKLGFRQIPSYGDNPDDIGMELEL